MLMSKHSTLQSKGFKKSPAATKDRVDTVWFTQKYATTTNQASTAATTAGEKANLKHWIQPLTRFKKIDMKHQVQSFT